MRQISRIALVAAVAVAVLSTTEVRADGSSSGDAVSTSPDQPEQPPQTEAPTAAAEPDVSLSPDQPEQPPQTEAPTAPAVPDASLSPDEPEQPPQTVAATPCSDCSFSPDEPEQPPHSDSPNAPAVTDATGAPSGPNPTAKPAHGCLTCEEVSASICLAGSYFAALLSNSALRSALLEAVRRDLCRLLDIDSVDLTITDTSITSQGLVIMYHVIAGNHTAADAVRSTAASLSTNGAALTDTTQMYSGATGNSNVTVSDSSAASSSDPQASSAWRLSGLVVAVFTVALGAFAL